MSPKSRREYVSDMRRRYAAATFVERRAFLDEVTTLTIRTKFIFGSSLAFNEVSKAIYDDFLPQALAQGRYVTATEPR